MATATRRHAIVNPARRRAKANRRRRKNPRRHMTAKQIKFFGTAAQRAGLKRRRKAKTHRSAPKRHNNARRHVAAAPRPRRKARRNVRHRARARRESNPGEILSLTLGNPGRRKGSMAATKHHKKRRRHLSARSRHNPRRRHVRRHNIRHHRRRSVRNPQFMDLFTSSVFIIGGAVGSKLLTQAVLGANNTGVFGYAGNAGATAVLATLAHMFIKNRKIRDSIIMGGAVQIVLRLISDYTPYGKFTASLGMGDYLASNFVTPQRYVNALESAQVEIPAGWGAPPIVVQKGGMSGLYDGWNDGKSLY